MIRLICIIFFVVIVSSIGNNLLSQKEDYNWVLGTAGKDNRPTEPYGNFIMSFDNESLLMKRIVSEAKMYNTNSVISNAEGLLQLYSNGYLVFGNNHKALPGLEEINRDSYWWRITGYPFNQAILILQDPGHKNQYYLIYCYDAKPPDNNDTIIRTNILRASLVNLEIPINPIVIYKDKDIHLGKFGVGEITATRHANGRDWWIVIPKRYSKDLFVFIGSKGYSILS